MVAQRLAAGHEHTVGQVVAHLARVRLHADAAAHGVHGRQVLGARKLLRGGEGGEKMGRGQ